MPFLLFLAAAAAIFLLFKGKGDVSQIVRQLVPSQPPTPPSSPMIGYPPAPPTYYAPAPMAVTPAAPPILYGSYRAPAPVPQQAPPAPAPDWDQVVSYWSGQAQLAAAASPPPTPDQTAAEELVTQGASSF